MRFGWGENAITARVRWYKTSSQQTVGPTVFGSHIWACDQKETAAQQDRGEPGEVWGASRKGVANTLWQDLPLVCNTPHGSPAAWLGEYTPGDPLYRCTSTLIAGGQAQGGSGVWMFAGAGGQRQGGEGEVILVGDGGQEQGGEGDFDAGFMGREEIGVIRTITSAEIIVDRAGTNLLESVVCRVERTATGIVPVASALVSWNTSGPETICENNTTNEEIDFISICNRGGSAEVVEVIYELLANEFTLCEAEIPAGATLQFTAAAGWQLVIDGVAQAGGGGGGGGSDPLTTKGDLFTFYTAAARLPVGADGQVPVGDSGAGVGLSYQWQNVVQRGYSAYTTHTALSTQIPQDDTIPQQTEGTEILTVSITPKDAANRLRVRFQGQVGGSQLTFLTAALFRDSTADAVASNGIVNHANGYAYMLGLEYEVAAGSTSATTFKIRVGPNAGNLYLNGDSSSRYFGGTALATLIVEEIRP